MPASRAAMKKPTSEAVGQFVQMLKGAAVGGLLHYRLMINPLPTPRPRVSKFGTYYPKSYSEYARDVQQQTAQVLDAEGAKAGPLEGRLGVVLDISVKRPKSSSLATPRGDVYNYAKGPLDAATQAGIWKDDTQIAVLAATKRFAEAAEEPGVAVWVAQLRD